MADAGLKPEKDFSKEVDKQIPEAQKLAKVSSDMVYYSLGIYTLTS
jgi:hypothetical protein